MVYKRKLKFTKNAYECTKIKNHCLTANSQIECYSIKLIFFVIKK